MKKQTVKLIPLLAAGIVPATALTTGLMSPSAMAATGDLDPGFGDVGRLGPILNGPAWALDEEDDDSMLLGGGDVYDDYYWGYYYVYATNFVDHLSASGQADPDFTAALSYNSQVFDVARQADGMVVAVGRKVSWSGPSSLIAFRLLANGSFDATFGDAGVFTLPTVNSSERDAGTSIVLDPDSRIVIAGSRNNKLVVLRLLPNGSPDASFGTNGIFTGPGAYDFSSDSSAGSRTNILRTSAGGYRVTASNAAGCQVVALTADGALDGAFGTLGISTVAVPSGASEFCNSMAAQVDGALLLAGRANSQAFATRLLATGQPDPGFSAFAVSNDWTEATAVAVAQDNSIVVAGRTVDGASIKHLQTNGDLDVLFGNAGSTVIDLPSENGTNTAIHDMYVRPDGGVVAAGGDHVARKAFVINLLGAGGGDSPGVLGLSQQTVIPTAEGAGEVVVNIRRTGGAYGDVSVAYQSSGQSWDSATSGEDYDAVSGRLTWTDGDMTEREIHIPVYDGGPAEGPEFFNINLSDLQGGAGFGTKKAVVEIAADGGPFGQLGFETLTYFAAESQSARVEVVRSYYYSGEVSVTLTPVAGSATAGSDFNSSPVTLTWADGEAGAKTAAFTIVDDTQVEPAESLTIELSNPTGGALLGPRSSATVWIQPSDIAVKQVRGGGATGYLSLLLLGGMAAMRWLRRVLRLRSDCNSS